jgi:hypothetical protein
MKRLYPWKLHVRKSNVEDHHRLRQPQYTGIPGWILLTHNQESKPIALFKDAKSESVVSIPLVVDERMCSDTILRVVKIGKQEYVVYDVDYWNGKSVFEIWNYETRLQHVTDMLDMFHSPLLSALIPIDNVPFGTLVRGYECYDDQPGSMGVFLPANT